MATKKVNIEDTFKLVVPNNEQVIDKVKQDLKAIAQGTLTIAKGTAGLVVGIVESKSITKANMDRIRGSENWTPSHINKLTKMFVRDLLGITDFNKFDKVKKQGLKKSMKIAVSLIIKGSLGKDKSDKSCTSKGELILNSDKFTPSQNKVWDSGNIGGMKTFTIKDAVSYSNDVLGFEDKSRDSALKLMFDRAFATISGDKSGQYENRFEDLPSDCRLLWGEWSRKLASIDKFLNTTKEAVNYK